MSHAEAILQPVIHHTIQDKLLHRWGFPTLHKSIMFLVTDEQLVKVHAWRGHRILSTLVTEIQNEQYRYMSPEFLSSSRDILVSNPSLALLMVKNGYKLPGDEAAATEQRSDLFGLLLALYCDEASHVEIRDWARGVFGPLLEAAADAWHEHCRKDKRQREDEDSPIDPGTKRPRLEVADCSFSPSPKRSDQSLSERSYSSSSEGSCSSSSGSSYSLSSDRSCPTLSERSSCSSLDLRLSAIYDSCAPSPQMRLDDKLTSLQAMSSARDLTGSLDYCSKFVEMLDPAMSQDAMYGGFASPTPFGITTFPSNSPMMSVYGDFASPTPSSGSTFASPSDIPSVSVSYTAVEASHVAYSPSPSSASGRLSVPQTPSMNASHGQFSKVGPPPTSPTYSSTFSPSSPVIATPAKVPLAPALAFNAAIISPPNANSPNSRDLKWKPVSPWVAKSKKRSNKENKENINPKTLH